MCKKILIHPQQEKQYFYTIMFGLKQRGLRVEGRGVLFEEGGAFGGGEVRQYLVQGVGEGFRRGGDIMTVKCPEDSPSSAVGIPAVYIVFNDFLADPVRV